LTGNGSKTVEDFFQRYMDMMDTQFGMEQPVPDATLKRKLKVYLGGSAREKFDKLTVEETETTSNFGIEKVPKNRSTFSCCHL
jgi:hypothetical protein